ncbi:MAG: gamma-glutamyl-gamma-aminobutyrate hydrolase family protein [Actinomycetia bacterium]|nr:gamma-glutamyl-gamma-aminobutyrate hydrolase family protein [Actinomycetes bacterium]MCP5028895.1 gamma-glutamyl-gamma-aminobutyrate hydrolase family protein [Actinomycetes bacterium]
MSAPLIGVPGRRKTAAHIDGLHKTMDAIDVDLFMTDYGRGVIEAGGVPIYLPFGVHPPDIVDRLDGLILTGGADIAPSWYGHEPETDMFPPEPLRDSFELALMEAAATTATPVLGICRGLQVANIHAGGTLHQDVPDHACFDLDPASEVHNVNFEPESTLRRLYGPTRKVNSLHHQTVDEVGDGYWATAHSDDGTVEGLEHFELPIAAVQWHPEMMTSRANDPAFTWIIEQAVERMGHHTPGHPTVARSRSDN